MGSARWHEMVSRGATAGICSLHSSISGNKIPDRCQSVSSASGNVGCVSVRRNI